MDEPISDLPKKEQGELLTIDGYHDDEDPCMFEIGMELSVLYCFCYVEEISTYMLEEQLSKEK